MGTKAKAVALACLLAVAIFLAPGCSTLIKTPSQKIPVTSSPIGATVLVDGREAGTTPLTLRLKRRKPGVIRIEKEGYDPHEIHVQRKRPGAFSTDALISSGNMLLAAPFAAALGPTLAPKKADDWGEAFANLWIGYFLAGAIVAIPLVVTDVVSGAVYTLSPKSLDIVLTPAGRLPRLGIIEIDEADLRNIKWLRIRTSGKIPSLQ